MNGLLARIGNAIGAGVAAMTGMVWSRYPRRWGLFGRLGDERDYAGIVGDGTGSPMVMACIDWIINAFTSMRPVVIEYGDDDETSTTHVVGHPAATLVRRPTYDPDTKRSWYGWLTLIAGIIISLIADGNGYVYKVRGAGGFGKPVQLWYIPHWTLEPRWVGTDYITYYDYSPDGVTHYAIAPADLIHIRRGLDPSNTRKGMSKLKPLLREIYTDEEAARWTASLLKNYGVPGAVIAPEQPLEDPDEAEEVKDEFRLRFSGDNRGMPIVLKGPTKVTPFGFSPDQMKLGDIRDIPEERVSAAIGIPAAVVGFGAGLQSTKVGATMAELVDLAWQNGVLPIARTIAAELTEQLLIELDPGTAGRRELEFDTSRVPIMADYHAKVAARIASLMKETAITRGDARRMLGLPVGPRDDVYVLQSGATEVDATKKVEPPVAAPAPAAIPAGAEAEPAALPEPAAAHALTEWATSSRDEHRRDMERMARSVVESSREVGAAIAMRSRDEHAAIAAALAGMAAHNERLTTAVVDGLASVAAAEAARPINVTATVEKGAVQMKAAAPATPAIPPRARSPRSR